MTKYRFDRKDVIHGSSEIEANCGNDAEEILMNMSLKNLLENSKFLRTKLNKLNIEFLNCLLRVKIM